MSMDTGKRPPASVRRRVAWLLALLTVVLGIVLAGVWLLPRVLSPAATSLPATIPPVSTPRPTFTATHIVPPTPTITPTPTPPVLYPRITGLDATVDDQARTITFYLVAEVPPDRNVAEAILWYDTQAGHQLRRTEGPLPDKTFLSYRLDAAQEGLTRTLTTTDELDYWWLVRDSAGESVRAGGTARLGPALLALVTAPTPEPPPVGFTWTVSETQHYQFHYAPGDAVERDRFRLGTLAEAAFERTRSVLNLDFSGKMGVYLVPRVFWQGGATYGDKVQLLSYLDRNYTDVETWSYFTHEGTHALAQDLIQPKQEGGPDGVLVEGFAVWASGGHYRQEPIDAWAAVVAASDAYIPLAKLRAGPFYDFQHETSYLEAGSFDKFLIRSYGLDTFKELYGQATGKAEQDEELVKHLYGKGYSDLEADWLSYLKGVTVTAEQAEAWQLEVRTFDLMRRYETELDPDARILPDKSPPEWTSDTLKIFLHRKDAPPNKVLETALIASQDRQLGGDHGGATGILDDLEAALAAGGALDRPSMQARLAIVGLLALQDRAVLRADASAYLNTFVPEYFPPGTLTTTLQLPFTAYQQELVRLDVTDDRQTAEGVVMIHGQLADGKFVEDSQLNAVEFVQNDGQWWMTARGPAEPILALPPPAQP